LVRAGHPMQGEDRIWFYLSVGDLNYNHLFKYISKSRGLQQEFYTGLVDGLRRPLLSC
jgi:hypothetical protein